MCSVCLGHTISLLLLRSHPGLDGVRFLPFEKFAGKLPVRAGGRGIQLGREHCSCCGRLLKCLECYCGIGTHSADAGCVALIQLKLLGFRFQVFCSFKYCIFLSLGVHMLIFNYTVFLFSPSLLPLISFLSPLSLPSALFPPPPTLPPNLRQPPQPRTTEQHSLTLTQPLSRLVVS